MSLNNRIHELKEMIRSSPYRCIIPEPTNTSTIAHPSCGDEITFSARIKDGKIIAICVQGSGCLLSQAAGVVAAAYTHNRMLTELAELSDDVLLERLNIGPVGPTRRQCITIVVDALKNLAEGLS